MGNLRQPCANLGATLWEPRGDLGAKLWEPWKNLVGQSCGTMLWAPWEPCGAKLWEPYLAKKLWEPCRNLEAKWTKLWEVSAAKLWEPCGNLGATLEQGCGDLWSLWNLGRTLRGKVVETLWEPGSKAVGTLALGQPWRKAVGTFGPLWDPCGNLEAKWAKLWEASGNLAAKLWEPCANLGAKLWEPWATLEQSCGNLGRFAGNL